MIALGLQLDDLVAGGLDLVTALVGFKPFGERHEIVGYFVVCGLADAWMHIGRGSRGFLAGEFAQSKHVTHGFDDIGAELDVRAFGHLGPRLPGPQPTGLFIGGGGRGLRVLSTTL